MPFPLLFFLAAIVKTLCFLETGGQTFSDYFPAIRPVPCISGLTKENGICMFKWSCIHEARGVHIGVCMDRFLIGSCCKLLTDGATSRTRYPTTAPTSTAKLEEKISSTTKHHMQDIASVFEILVSEINRQREKNFTATTANILKHFTSQKVPFTDVTLRTTRKPYTTVEAFNLWKSSQTRRTNFVGQTTSTKSIFPSTSSLPISEEENRKFSDENSISSVKNIFSQASNDVTSAASVSSDRLPPGEEDGDQSLTANNDLLSPTNVADPASWRSTHPLHQKSTTSLPTTKNEAQSAEESQEIVMETFSVENNERVCGRSQSGPMGRIVGGTQSQYLRWPWMISLRRFEGKTFKHKCGAALLNHMWAVTAAHCVDSKLPTDLLLRLGEYNFHDENETLPYLERRIQLMVIHPRFDSVTYENDLALLRFYEPVSLKANILPVCLPQESDDQEGKIAVVTGWGRLTEDGALPGYLHEVHMPILTNQVCEAMYADAGYVETIPDVFICAGVPEGGLDACEGDSGGPMMVKNNQGQWTLVGLISWGMGCAAPSQPGVYTRITKFVDWINHIIAL